MWPVGIISWLSHVIYSGQAPGHGAIERVRGSALVNSPSVSRSAFISRFPPSNKFINVWACTHYEKYSSGIMIFPRARTRQLIH